MKLGQRSLFVLRRAGEILRLRRRDWFEEALRQPPKMSNLLMTAVHDAAIRAEGEESVIDMDAITSGLPADSPLRDPEKLRGACKDLVGQLLTQDSIESLSGAGSTITRLEVRFHVRVLHRNERWVERV